MNLVRCNKICCGAPTSLLYKAAEGPSWEYVASSCGVERSLCLARRAAGHLEISKVNSPRTPENKDECHGGSLYCCPESEDEQAGSRRIRNAEIRDAQIRHAEG